MLFYTGNCSVQVRTGSYLKYFNFINNTTTTTRKQNYSFLPQNVRIFGDIFCIYKNVILYAVTSGPSKGASL